MKIKYSKYLLALLLLTVFLDTASASSVAITSEQDYMQQQFVSNGSFPSGLTDLIYRMRLHIKPMSGNFQVSKVVIYNTTSLGINRTYYQIDEMEMGRGNVSVFPDRVEWQGLNETPVFDFELGIHAGRPYRHNIPFSSTRSIDKDIFNGQDIITGSGSVTTTQNLRNLKMFVYASESDDIYSKILYNTATNTGSIDRSSPDEVAWNIQNVLVGNMYTASVKGSVTPKKNGTIRAWPYSRIEAGYGTYSYTSNGYGATVVRYTDTVIGDVEIHFINPVDYRISANGRGTYNQRFKAYSEVITNGEPATINIDDNFKPGVRTVPSGTTITWKNDQNLPHIIVSNTGLFSSQSLTQNQQFSYTFNSPGTYDYSCSNYPSMTGRVIVISSMPTPTPSPTPTVTPTSAVTPSPTASPSPTTGGDLVSRYAGSDGIVQKSEAVQAVMDYFSGIITRQEAISVVMAYFGG